MPARTNERQQIIKMLKDMLADPKCDVTESKMLIDAVTLRPREVDVVAEYDNDGDLFVQSFEVTSKGQVADITWAEQLIQKHANLPTDRLYLVSWSGVTDGVVELVKSRPDVRVITPEVVQGPDGPEVKTLFIDMVRLNVLEVIADVERPNGERGKAILEPDYVLCREDGTEVGAAVVFWQTTNDPTAIELVLRQAHEHPERDELKSFTLGRDYGPLEIYLRKGDSVVELQRIRTVEVRGGFLFEQAPLEMEVRAFAGQRFAHGRFEHSATSGLVVALLNENVEPTKITATIKVEANTLTRTDQG